MNLNDRIKTFAFLRLSPWNTPQYKNQKELGGLYNGYVGIRKDIYDEVFIDPRWRAYAEMKHYTLYDYDNTKVSQEVHGGITYMNECSIPIEIIPLTNVPITDEIINNYIIVGFDTSHHNDNSDIWDYNAVKAETLKWKENIDNQINNYYKNF